MKKQTQRDMRFSDTIIEKCKRIRFVQSYDTAINDITAITKSNVDYVDCVEAAVIGVEQHITNLLSVINEFEKCTYIASTKTLHTIVHKSLSVEQAGPYLVFMDDVSRAIETQIGVSIRKDQWAEKDAESVHPKPLFPFWVDRNEKARKDRVIMLTANTHRIVRESLLAEHNKAENIVTALQAEFDSKKAALVVQQEKERKLAELNIQISAVETLFNRASGGLTDPSTVKRNAVLSCSSSSVSVHDSRWHTNELHRYTQELVEKYLGTITAISTHPVRHDIAAAGLNFIQALAHNRSIMARPDAREAMYKQEIELIFIDWLHFVHKHARVDLAELKRERAKL